MKKIYSISIVLFLLFYFTGISDAKSVLLSEGRNYYAHYGDPSWSIMASVLDSATANSVTVVPNFENYAQMQNYDALWLDQRYQGVLTSNEINNISTFIGTGRKLVMIGENDNWNNFNIQIIGIVGGTYGGGFDTGTFNSIVSNELTSGVSKVYLPSGAYVISGGTALFNYNFATLWGSNALTVLDSNLFTNTYWNYENNSVFGTNIANWIANSSSNPVPEPATMLLLGSGLIGLAGYGRKRLFKK